ncbi:MAG: hypothetical protein JNK15_02045 [Planctomycetes bacterium]|nr:hypothetical protein [Planctomycetota bacterium]
MLRLLVVGFATAVALASQAPTDLARVVAAFAPFDLDGDGRAEVRALEPIADVGLPAQPLVVVLVEGRLWRGNEGDRVPGAFPGALRRYAADVAADGHRVLLLAVDVHAGPPHQDGRTVLALRRLLQRLHAHAPMSAAVLVGHFPDALLVRTCNWRRNEKLELPGRDGKPVAIDAATTNVRAVPEVVAHRCDLVLADLDGDWERVYVPGPTTLRSAWATFGASVPEAGGPCAAMQVGELPVTDVFHVRDGAAIADVADFTLRLDAADRDRECTAADRALGNPLARPEIAVSRIDARGVAWRNDAERHVAADPLSFDPTMRAIPASTAAGDGPPAWKYSGAEEVDLLVRHFDRNHAFRTQPLPAGARRPASIAHELGAGLDALRAADPAWAEFAEPGYDVHTGADLAEVVRWLARPAVLRTLRAHSDPFTAAFAASDPAALDELFGPPCHWVRDGDRFVASWREHRGGRADFVFWRAVHRRQGPNGGPFLLLHTGCEALSPPGATQLPYDHPDYGKFAHAESLLFFSECVAMVGRAKVFYDEPREFAATLGAGQTIGRAWQRYFEVEASAERWDDVGGDIGRKRAYFWSIVGDCTLRLPRR